MLKTLKAFFIKKAMWIFLFAVAGISIFFMVDKMKGEGWRFTVYMDGRGYYAHLPAFFIYDDPSCSFYSSQSAITPDVSDFINDIDGKPVNKYFIGEAFLQAPFFGMAHLVAKSSGDAPSGYSKTYFYFFAIGALFYFLLGLFFTWKLLEKFFFRKRVILFVCICFAFGTNLFHYALFEPSMSHVYSFAAVAAFLYFTRCFFLSPSRKYILLAAAALGIVAILRPVNLALLFAFPALAGDWEKVKEGFQWMRRNVLSTCIAVLLFLLVGFVQLFIYHWQTGHYFVWAYRNEGFDFSHTNFFGTLFGFEKGLFVYTPMIFIAISGIFVMVRRSRYMAFTLFAVLAIIAWIVSSWHEWKYGYSFGLRAYIDYYALAALSMAFLIDFAFTKKIILAPVTIICLLLISLYGIQNYQYLHRIIHAGAMDKDAYWLVFLKTDKKYEDTITFSNLAMESDGDFNDMEGVVKWPGLETIREGNAFSGTHASRIDSTNLYSCGFVRIMSDNPVFYHPSRLIISAYVARDTPLDSADLVIAQAREDRIFYLTQLALPAFEKAGKWEKVSYEIIIPGFHEEGEVLKVFFRQKSGVVYIDDFNVNVKGR